MLKNVPGNRKSFVEDRCQWHNKRTDPGEERTGYPGRTLYEHLQRKEDAAAEAESGSGQPGGCIMELTQSDKAAEEFARKAKEAEKEEVSNAGDL